MSLPLLPAPRSVHALSGSAVAHLTLLLALLFAPTAHAQVTALFEDFEDASVEYITSVLEFSDGSEDFFLRTDGSNISGSYEVDGFNGSFYFAAQDVDGEGATPPVSLVFSAIDIAGLTDLEFSALFAEDDGSSESWDGSDYVRVFASIDGADPVPIFGIENDGSRFNSAPFVDTDLDGVGEGAEITDTFAEFTASIPGTGSTLDLRIEIDLGAGGEDIALDDVTVTGSAVVEDTTAPTCGVGAVNAGPPQSVDFALEDSESGILTVEVTGSATNAVVEIPQGSGNIFNPGDVVSFTPPETSGFTVRGIQVDGSLPAVVELVVTDADGNATACSETLPAEVTDTEAPVCGDLSFVPAGNTWDVVTSATDNVGITSLTFTTLTPNLDGRVSGAGDDYEEGDVVAFDPAVPSVDFGARFNTLSAASFFVTVADAAGNTAVCDPVVTDLAGALPETTALSPAYPNPARVSSGAPVSVPFRLAEASKVRVVVYDVLGREVAVLADGVMEPGSYEVSWPEASSLPSGSYVVRMTAGVHVQTQRLTLVR